jgi:hypothetical protein
MKISDFYQLVIGNNQIYSIDTETEDGRSNVKNHMGNTSILDETGVKKSQFKGKFIPNAVIGEELEEDERPSGYEDSTFLDKGNEFEFVDKK